MVAVAHLDVTWPSHIWRRMIDALPPVLTAAAFAHQMRLSKDAEVARNGRPRHREAGGDLRHGCLPSPEPVEYGPPSGIGDGKETTGHRLRSKQRQLARYPDEPVGHAIVTNFGTAPVEIRVGASTDE